jgi:hypothetical protein
MLEAYVALLHTTLIISSMIADEVQGAYVPLPRH